MKSGILFRLLGAALLLGVCPGCFVRVDDTPKRGVDVKIEREPNKGLDIDVDVNTPKNP